jgi:putative aldouronate transport system permease protein
MVKSKGIHIRKKSISGEKLFDFSNAFALVLLSLIFLYPLWHVLMASLSEPVKLVSNSGPVLKPLGFSLNGYSAVFKNKNIVTGYYNTIFYVAAGTALNMFFTIFGAYVLSRRNLALKKLIMMMVVITMYLHAGLIPDFLLVRNLGLYNSRFALLVPQLIGTWNMIVMKTSFTHVPSSLEESAMIDGAGDLTILARIILPVSKATLAVMVLFYAVGHWNSWFSAAIYLKDRSKFPLQLFLREILIANTSMGYSQGAVVEDIEYLLDEVIKYCSIIVATVPILLIYPMIQKYFIKGVMLGSIKE